MASGGGMDLSGKRNRNGPVWNVGESCGYLVTGRRSSARETYRVRRSMDRCMSDQKRLNRVLPLSRFAFCDRATARPTSPTLLKLLSKLCELLFQVRNFILEPGDFLFQLSHSVAVNDTFQSGHLDLWLRVCPRHLP